MERINVYSSHDSYDGVDVFAGWFDMDRAEKLASYSFGDPYKNGKILLATASKKLVINVWNNCGYDEYRFADDEAEIAEILSRGGYDGDDKKLNEILDKYEI